jgi:hypothetical protein
MTLTVELSYSINPVLHPNCPTPAFQHDGKSRWTNGGFSSNYYTHQHLKSENEKLPVSPETYLLLANWAESLVIV